MIRGFITAKGLGIQLSEDWQWEGEPQWLVRQLQLLFQRGDVGPEGGFPATKMVLDAVEFLENSGFLVEYTIEVPEFSAQRIY